MKKFAALFAVAAVVAGCSTPDQKATVSDADGGTITVSRIQEMGFTERFQLVSTAGWKCEASSTWPALGIRTSANEIVPITCDNGITGSGQIEFGSRLREDSNMTPLTFAYSLTNGAKAEVRL